MKRQRRILILEVRMDVLGIVVGGALLVMFLTVVLKSAPRSRHRAITSDHSGGEAAWFASDSGVDCSSDAGGGCDGGGGGD